MYRINLRILLVLLFFVMSVPAAFAERPSAPQLFPSSTLAYFRVDNVPDLKNRWQQTSTGKMLADPQIAPLVGEFYSSMLQVAQDAEKEIGLKIEEILEIPQGEVAFALIPGETSSEPSFLWLLEAGDRMAEVEILLERATRQSNGEKREKVSFVEAVSVFPERSENGNLAYFIDQGVIVVSNNFNTLKKAAQVWTNNSVGHKPMSENSDFLAIMSRCTGTKGERPQISFYVNPMAIAKEATKESISATAVMALLPALGIDGIKGVGGSVILAPENFDSIVHFHLLLESPPRGALAVIRPKEGAIDPETWVAEDVAAYLTINWKTQPTIAGIENLVDTFQGPGFFEENVIKNASRELKLDFRKDVLQQIDDRFSLVQVFLRPATINAGSNVFAIKVKDAKRVESDILPKIFATIMRNEKRWQEIDIDGHAAYHLNIKTEGGPGRIPDPCITVLDDRVLIADSKRAIELVLETYASGENLLLDSLEYKVIKQRISAQIEGMKVCGLTMSRPEESLRVFYDMAADPKNRDRLAEMAEQNPFFAALNNALQKHQLPEFDTIRKYVAPAGGFVSEDDSGIHYTTFGIRRD